MKWVNADNRIPIKSWCEDVESGAMEQAVNLANHPTTFHHIALMPDCHQGYGMPIGGVIACDGAVIPNAVGVDIGCGMVAAKTDMLFEDIDTKTLEAVIAGLKEHIPVGFSHHEEPQQWNGFLDAPDIPVIQQELESSRRQIGTLGGGNHFIEIQAGSDGRVWLMLHSGSRNFGYKIAQEYNRRAMDLCARWHSALPPGKGEDSLPFLPIGLRDGREYIEAMNFALRFARANRDMMMSVVERKFGKRTGAEVLERINIHHNFAAIEKHFGRWVWVHRKGATQARDGQMGIIPGSMGTSSYIVRGLGNKESFESCSHGAGRSAGRAEFCRTHTVEECDEAMDGIIFGGWGRNRKGDPDISEAPGAYKNIDDVIASESDLVEVVVKLRPLGVMKG